MVTNLRRMSLFPLTLVLIGALLVGCSTPPEEAATEEAYAVAEMIPISTDSTEAMEAYLRGRDLNDKLRFREARDAFGEAVAADSGFALGHLSLAQTQATAKGFFEHLQHAVDLADGASEGERLWILAAQAGANGDPVTQEKNFKALVDLHPEDPRAHTLLGTYYFGQQQYDKAIGELEAATSLDPLFSSAYNQLGYSHRFLGDYESAEKAFKKYIEVIPDDPNPYDSYAELLMKTGRFEESIEQYRKALEINPQFPASYLGIASNLTYLGRHEEARTELETAKARAADDGQMRGVLFMASATWVDEGKFDLALAEITSARAIAEAASDTATLAGDDVTAANILLQQGDTDGAQELFDQARDLMEGSGLDPAVISNAMRAHLANSTRVAVAAGELEAAKAMAAEYLASENSNRFQVWQGHQLNGLIALAEERWEDAVAEFEKANPLNTFDRFRRAQALEGLGDAEGAAALYADVTSFNPVFGINHAFVRQAAAAKAGT